MTDYASLAAVLVALLIGLTVGKAWERYKLRDGRWIDRRKARESPHYILGLNFLVSNQIDLAIEELTRAASSLTSEALEIDMILGNLYREKGQVGRAIQIHQALLQRPKLTSLEHAYVLLCLGLDFKRAGFVDRALEAFNQVLRLDPRNHHALVNLEKLHEEQHQWPEAYRIRQQLTSASEPDDEPRNREILAFLETQLGEQARRQGDAAGARLRFEAAIEMEPTTAPAYLNLGDMQLAEGQVAQAI
ncbi:MAG: tetratricopeptide repeat protein, partial [Bacteroidales bacterium]